MLQQQQNLGRRFGASGVHKPRSPVALAAVRSKAGGSVVDTLLIVTPIVGLCNSSMFCCALLCVHSGLQSSWLGGESWLLCFVCLHGVS